MKVDDFAVSVPLARTTARTAFGHRWIARRASGWQFGEQGILDAILEVLGDGGLSVCEFGAGNGVLTELTCQRLIERGWKALLIERNHDGVERIKDATAKHPAVEVLEKSVGYGKADGIEAVLAAQNWLMPDVMIVDIDGPEWYVLNGMEKMPRVLIVEHRDLNDTLNPPTPLVPRLEDCGLPLIWNRKDFVVQANGPALDALLKDRMVCVCETRLNSFYVSPEDAARLDKPDVCLNLGAGPTRIEGYIPIDIETGTDIRSLPYPDESVDEIYASHVLEHVSEEDSWKALAEWARVLKPNGRMRIGVPDLDKICDRWDGLSSYHLTRVLYGSQDYPDNFHRWGYTAETLRHAMNRVGIVGVEPFEPFTSDCTRHPMSLNMEGRKRDWKTREYPSVVWIVTQGRFALTAHTMSMVNLAHNMKFGMIPCAGVFWERDMASSIQLAMKTNADIFMFTDFDSVFRAEDAEYMLDVLNKDKTIAAVTAPQMSRHDDKPLVFEKHMDYSGEFTEVKFAHFGLAMFRREVFEELPQPWFWTIPGMNRDAELGYDFWNRSDADITFWRNMHEAGLKVVQCNRAVIGHLVEAVKWPCNKGSGVQLQPMSVYNRLGRPATATINQDIYRKKMDEAQALSIPASPMHAITEEQSGALANHSGQG